VTTQRLIKTEHSSIFLPESSPLRRLPRGAKLVRRAGFFARYEDRALAYDCFWHEDGERILLVGPPPLNLRSEQRAARFSALPSRSALSVEYYPTPSTMITALSGAPKGTTEILMQFSGEEFAVKVERTAGPFHHEQGQRSCLDRRMGTLARGHA
jgi:hypothetical protein